MGYKNKMQNVIYYIFYCVFTSMRIKDPKINCEIILVE